MIHRLFAKGYSQLRLLSIRLRGRGSKVSLRAYIDHHTSVASPVFLSKGVRVFASSLGRNVRLEASVHLSHSIVEQQVLIGGGSNLCESSIGAYSYFAGRDRLYRTKVGRFCSIAPELICCPGIHPLDFISTSPVFFSTANLCGTSFAERDYFNTNGTVEIGNDVWIGTRVIIKDNIRVGDGAVIAAGAVVVKDVPPYAIVGGVPARTIRFRFEDDVIHKLLELQWWNWPESKLREAQPFFAVADPRQFFDWVELHRATGVSSTVISTL